MTFSRGLGNLTCASVYRRTTVSINTELKVVVDLLTMTHMSAFENNRKWKGSKERDEEKDE